MMELLTFLSTLALLIVTGWYAVLTRSLARSARDSADSARVAAEHAARTAAAAVATVDVSFEASPAGTFDSFGQMTLGITLSCTGATVFVHSADLLSAWRTVDRDHLGEEQEEFFSDSDGRPLAIEAPFPIRFHKDERITLETEPELMVDESISVAVMTVRVSYSLDGVGPVIDRDVVWYSDHEVDDES